MGYQDRELISGNVPWLKKCDMSIADVVARCKSIGIKKAFWSKKLEVEFTSRKLSGAFSTPPDFEIGPLAARVAAARLIELFAADYSQLRYVVDKKTGNIEINLEQISLVAQP